MITVEWVVHIERSESAGNLPGKIETYILLRILFGVSFLTLFKFFTSVITTFKLIITN